MEISLRSITYLIMKGVDVRRCVHTSMINMESCEFCSYRSFRRIDVTFLMLTPVSCHLILFVVLMIVIILLRVDQVT